MICERDVLSYQQIILIKNRKDKPQTQKQSKMDKSIFLSNPQIQPKSPKQASSSLLITENVMQAYEKLHHNIDQMQHKVQHVISKHQSEFLLAYRTHITKIKKQLGEIKKRSEDQEKMFSANDRIKFLEKQIAVFREEAIRVYEKLEKTSTELELYKRKYDDISRMYQLSQRDMRQSIKLSKSTLLNHTVCDEKIRDLEKKLQQKQKQIMRLTKNSDQKYIKGQETGRNLFGSIGSERSRNRYQKFEKIDNSRDSTYRKSVLGQSTILDDVNFRDIFFSCVKALKKQIGFRKSSEKLNLHLMDISQFRQMDKIRVLQRFFSDPALERLFYERLFPNLLLEKLQQKKQIQQKPKGLFQLTTTGFVLPKMKQGQRRQTSKLESKNKSFL